MKQLDMPEVRDIQLQVLDEVAAYCRGAGLTWFAAAGTLIGALRHQGFIPWDDDIDLALPRPDFERFLREFDAPGFKVASLVHDPHNSFPFAKVWREGTLLVEDANLGVPIGINIDVFPIDGLGNGVRAARLRVSRILLLRSLFGLRTIRTRSGRAPLKNLGLAVGRAVTAPVRPAMLSRRITDLATAHSLEESRLAGIAVWQNGLGEITPADTFASSTVVHFESRELPAPVGYDAWLQGSYGDWRTPPPPEKRVTHHAYSAYRV